VRATGRRATRHWFHRRDPQSAGGAIRKALDTYLLCLHHGAEYAKNARPDDPPEKWLVVYADTMSEYVEKSWQDYRNNLQIMLLTQDEALIWISKIDKVLTAA